MLGKLSMFHVHCSRKMVYCPRLGARVHISRTVKGLIFILSYLQSSNLACYRVTDADRRHETPGSETKTLLVRAEQAA